MNSNVPVPPSNGGGLSGDRVTRGTVARWSATTGWVDRDGLPLPDTMLVVGYTTVLRRWKDKKPEYITEQPLRDPKVLNDAIPVEEWEIGLDGNPTPPWKLTYVIYFVDSQDRRSVHVRARYIRGHALLQQLGRCNQHDAPAPRRACASNRAPRKAPVEVAEVRDADAPASAADRMAYARWRWS